MRNIEDALSSIRDSINEADRLFEEYAWTNKGHDAGLLNLFEYYMDQAFLELRVLLEAKGLPDFLAQVRAEHAKASTEPGLIKTTLDGDPYSPWTARLRLILQAIESTFSEAAISRVTKDVIDIVRATQYSITDAECFGAPPNSEREVHARIEAVLKCVFADVRHKPRIAKPIKNFDADTGLPSIQTLIEYKFVASQPDVKRVSEEVLADTRGYVSRDWTRFLFVVYETKRLQPESTWNALLKEIGVLPTTQIVVLCAESKEKSDP